MRASSLKLDRKRIQDFCERHHIRKLSIFGSALRADFKPDSDLDILVEFQPGHVPGLEFFAIQDELSRLLGRQVDLSTPGFLSKYFRNQVLKEARVIYEQARQSDTLSTHA